MSAAAGSWVAASASPRLGGLVSRAYAGGEDLLLGAGQPGRAPMSQPAMLKVLQLP